MIPHSIDTLLYPGLFITGMNKRFLFLFKVLNLIASLSAAFNRFDKNILKEIGSFLPVPQVLRRLNSVANETFSDKNTFRQCVAERLGIPEILQCENEAELLWFKEMFFIKDKQFVFDCLCHAIFAQKLFKDNGKVLVRYIMKQRDLISNYYLSHEILIQHLLYTNDYEYLVDSIENDLDNFQTFFVLLSYDQRNLIIKGVMTKKNALKLLTDIYNSLTSDEYRCRFLAFTMFNNVHEEFYSSRLLNNFNLFGSFIIYTCTKVKKITFDNEIIYEKLVKLLNQAYSIDSFPGEINKSILMKHLFYFSSLVEVGFGNNNQKYDITDIFYEFDYLKCLAVSAAVSHKKDTFIEIFSHSVEIFFDHFQTIGIAEFEPRFIFYALELLNESECNYVHNLSKFFRIILKHYFINSFLQFDDKIFINCVLLPSYLDYDIPLHYNYSVNVDENNFSEFDILWKKLKQIDCVEFENFLKTLFSCKIFNDFLKENKGKPVLTNMNVISLLMESENIRNVISSKDLKFTIDRDDFIELLHNDQILNLKKILVAPDICYILPHLRSDQQIKNLELFLEKNISQIMKEEVFTIFEIDTKEAYIEYRHIFRYWLKSGQNGKIQKLKSKFIISLLSKEAPDEYSLLKRKIKI